MKKLQKILSILVAVALLFGVLPNFALFSNAVMDDTNLKFIGSAGISFQDYIGMNVMFQNSLASKYDKFYVKAVQKDPEKGDVESICGTVPYFHNGIEYTIFEHQVMAWSMTEEVTLTLYAELNGVTYIGQTIKGSVQSLALEKLKSYAAANNKIACAALVDMLNYGAALQVNQKHNVESLPTAGTYASYGTTTTPEMTAENTTSGSSTMTHYGPNISMQAKVEFNVMFSNADAKGRTIKAFVNGEEVEVMHDTTTAAGWTIARIAIAANKLRSNYTIAMYDANGNVVSKTINTSIEACAKTKLGTANEELIIALMRYGDAVKLVCELNDSEHTHNYAEATCTIPARCACGVSIGSALGHKEVIDAAVAPTESTTGLTEGIHCERCNIVIVPQKIIGALGSTESEDGTQYIELSSEEDIYALARILSRESTKSAFYGSEYAMANDLDRFEYPDTVTGNAAKRAYLSTAAYKLTADLTLKMQRANNTSFFVGIGSTDYPFQGIFNGNGKTITLTADDTIAFNGNMSPYLGLFGRAASAEIVDTNIKIEQDLIANRSVQRLTIGPLIGKAIECEITNCTVTILDACVGAEYAEGEKYVSQVWIGGLVGESTDSIIKGCTVTLKNSTLQAKAYVVLTDARYANFAVGGILGFSQPGGDNTENIGKVGNQVMDCHLISSNTSQRDVIIGSVRNGEEIVAGGLIGCTFNNFVAKDCTVDIKKGNIVAEKTRTNDNGSSYGTTVGGFIGRLEHTGELYNCTVNGDYLNIIAKSPENKTSVGGIVGTDIGPYHKDVVSLNGCSFDGNRTSVIELQVTQDDTVDKWNALGGIVGYGNYRIQDCAVKGVTLKNHSENVEKSYVGGICGLYNNYGFWAYKTYFIPQKPGIFDCTMENIVFDTADLVKTGDQYAFAQ